MVPVSGATTIKAMEAYVQARFVVLDLESDTSKQIKG